MVSDVYWRRIGRKSLIAAFAWLPASLLAADAWTLDSLIDPPDNLKINGSFRTRYEYLDGQARANLKDSTELLSLRTTFAAEYRASRFRIGGEIYDSRVYLGDTRTGIGTTEVNALELVQAYVGTDFEEPFGAGTRASLQAGRMMLNLGTRRLVAADDYRNTTNGYTGLRVDASRKGGASSTFVYVLPQRRLPDDQLSILDNDIEFDTESSALVLWGGLVTVPELIGGASVEPSFFRLTEVDEPDLATRNRRLNTGSLRVFRDPAQGQWDYEVEAVYQTGTIRASTARAAGELDVSAYFYHLELGYQSQAAWQPRVSFEYDVMTGDDGDSDFGRFDTLFGMRRGDFPPSGIYAAIGRANMQSPGVRVDVAPNKRLDAFVAYRALWLESSTDSFSTTNVRDAGGQSGDFAGHQLDMRARYWLVPRALRLEANIAFLIKGRFLEQAPNAPATGDTSYIAISLTSTL